jgi:hypothetical protein
VGAHQKKSEGFAGLRSFALIGRGGLQKGSTNKPKDDIISVLICNNSTNFVSFSEQRATLRQKATVAFHNVKNGKNQVGNP